MGIANFSQYSRQYRKIGLILVVILILLLLYGNFPAAKMRRPEVVRSAYANQLSECLFVRKSDGRAEELKCPDIRRLGNTTERQCELVLTRMLRVFDLIAKKHNIRYWLYEGTLLGAVRNKGHYNVFDNDLDIAILREDYEKFVREAVDDLPEGMFWQTEQSDPHWKVVPYSNMLAKIRDTNSCYNYCSGYGCEHRNGLMVDVLVIDQDTKGFLVEAHTSSSSVFYRYLFGPQRTPYSDVFPLTEKLFDGYYFPVPCRWNQVLVDRYGSDYMQEPSNQKFGFAGTDPLNACPPNS